MLEVSNVLTLVVRRLPLDGEVTPPPAVQDLISLMWSLLMPDCAWIIRYQILVEGILPTLEWLASISLFVEETILVAVRNWT